jgi:hypothetical protein
MNLYHFVGLGLGIFYVILQHKSNASVFLI